MSEEGSGARGSASLRTEITGDAGAAADGTALLLG